MKITIIYDNEVFKSGLKSKWGFSCLVEVENQPRILFDTGGDEKILLHNLKKLNISPETIDEIFISHSHWDHTGGFSAIFEKNKEVDIYLPPSCHRLMRKDINNNVNIIENPQQIHDRIFSTGELQGMEQSLIVETDKGLVVIVGCSHPGVGLILDVASQFGDVYALIGGLHGFKNFNRLKNLEKICATHCTKFKTDINSIYPEKIVEGGVGKVIKI